MTSTETAVDWTVVLRRVDTKLAKRTGDDPLPVETIAAFARAVEDHAGAAPNGTAPAESAEHDALRDALEKANAELEQLRKRSKIAGGDFEILREQADSRHRECEELRAENATLADQLAQATKTAELAAHLRIEADGWKAELDALTAERNELREHLKAAKRPRIPAPPAHIHAYPWESPDKLPGACACGKQYPGGLGYDPDDDAGDSVVIGRWDEIMDELRVELEGWPS